MTSDPGALLLESAAMAFSSSQQQWVDHQETCSFSSGAAELSRRRL